MNNRHLYESREERIAENERFRLGVIVWCWLCAACLLIAITVVWVMR